MKNFLFFVICILLCLPARAENSVLEKAELRVLDIGNGYTRGVTRILPLIAKASKVDLSTMCLYQCYRSEGSFKNWVDIYNDNDIENTYSISKVIGGLSANVQTGKGEAGDGKLFRDVLTKENWDLIIIHQVSTYAPYYSEWNNNDATGYLDELISIIKECQPNAELGFLLVHSYWSEYSENTEKSSYDRWQLIANSAKSFCEDYGVDFVIPYGTAIQNLRSSSLNNEYDLTRDGTQCGYGLAEYTAACCYYEALIAPRCGISVLGNSARIDVSDKESKYPSVNVTDENALIAQEAAYLATKDMYLCQNPEDYIFKLIYKVDGEVYKSDNIAYGMEISPEAAPEKEGYSFSGWSEIPSTMPAMDVTVTGFFTIKIDGKEINRDIELQGGDIDNNGNVKRITNSREDYLKYLNTPVFLNAQKIKAINNIEDGENVKFYCYTEDFKFIGTTTNYKLLEGTVWVKIKIENNCNYIGTKVINVTYVTNGLPDTKNTYSLLSKLSFSYEVFDKTGNTESSILENERHFDNGMIILPPNYSNTGEPVRLVIFAHGTGGFSWTSSGSYQDLLEFVAMNGYAVCDCCGMSDKYSIGELAPPISDARHNLMSISCYCSMYEFLMKNFNLKDDGCFMFGKSNGGIATTYMSQAQPIPIIASAGLAPSISIIESLRYTRGGSLQYWADRLGLNVDCSNVAEKTHLYKVEPDNQDIVNYLKSHANLFSHIDPFVMQTDIDANEIATAFFSKPYLKANENKEVYKIISKSKKTQTCPMILFHALDDKAVPYDISKWYVEMCKKTDSPCFLRTIPSGYGGHFAVDKSEEAPKVSFTTIFGETVQIVETYKELVEWFNMFDCQDPETYTFKIIYVVDGELYKIQYVEYGAKITSEPFPVKEGYSFSGWSEIPETMPAKGVAVTGSFTVNKYKLIYKVDGADYKSYDVEYGASITPEEAPVKEGYTFSGWSDIPSKMPLMDVTVKGSFTINKYKLKYIVDGVKYKTQEIEYGTKITPEAVPEKEGYSFSGWSEIPSTMPAKDVTVTGSFTQTNGIISVIKDSPGVLIYDMQGRRIDHLQKGLNIIRMSDGKTKKVIL